MYLFRSYVRKGGGDGDTTLRVSTNRPNLQHKRFGIDTSKKLSGKYSKTQE